MLTASTRLALSDIHLADYVLVVTLITDAIDATFCYSVLLLYIVISVIPHFTAVLLVYSAGF